MRSSANSICKTSGWCDTSEQGLTAGHSNKLSDCYMGGARRFPLYTHAGISGSSTVFNIKDWAAKKPRVALRGAPHIILHPRLLRSFKALA